MERVNEVYSPRGAFEIDFTFDYDGYHHGGEEKMPRDLPAMLEKLWPLCRRFLLVLYMGSRHNDEDVRQAVHSVPEVHGALRRAVWARRLHHLVIRDADGSQALVLEGACAAVRAAEVKTLCANRSIFGRQLTLLGPDDDVLYVEGTRSRSERRGAFFGDEATLRVLGRRPEGLGRLTTPDLRLEGSPVEPETLERWLSGD